MSPTISPPQARQGLGWIHPQKKVTLMVYERVAAWTLVAVYYTVFLGVIVLGLRGAL